MAAYQIVFIEGVFTKDNIPYTYEEKYSYINGADFPKLNTSVCSHVSTPCPSIENWRSKDSTFSTLSVHCTLYEIDIRNMLIVQLSFYDAQLTSAGNSPDPHSVAKAVEEWLERVTPKNRKFEYRSTVIAPCLDLPKQKFFNNWYRSLHFSVLVCSQEDFLITYQFPEEKAELECIDTGSADKYIWRRNGSIVREDAVKYTSVEHGRILMISNTQLADARQYTCEHTDGNILRKVWLAVPQYASPKFQVIYVTAPSANEYPLTCCVRYKGILSEVYFQLDKMKRYHSKSSNGEVVFRHKCIASSPTATFHLEFRIRIDPIPVPQPPCDDDLSGLSADKTFKVVGAVIFEGKSLKYHPRLNELPSVERANLQSSVCNYLETEMRRDKLVSREFPIRCKMLEIHPITHEAIFQLTVYGIHMTSFGLDSDDTGFAEFARVIFHERNESTVGYHLRSLSTG
ncbi:hypothetical protein FGIG_01098 [Fasciola gigantica]|uniref:Ig-like domain-containing protein n=1 Tax=Fasciola gigantica TaxID=46835 RepID=A0A504Y7Z9_FASGI|nr:hypothetical protein FGIG_01098 [Fasciola gigantica]